MRKSLLFIASRLIEALSLRGLDLFSFIYGVVAICIIAGLERLGSLHYISNNARLMLMIPLILCSIIGIDTIYNKYYKKKITQFCECNRWEIVELRRAKPWQRGPFSWYPPDCRFIYVLLVRTESGHTRKAWIRGHNTGDIRWARGPEA